MSDCQTCGACCFSDSDAYVPVTGDDHARLGDAAAELTVFIGNRCYMRMHDTHCIALKRQGQRFACTTYETRPEICRELMRGSPACQAEMVLKGPLVRANLAMKASKPTNTTNTTHTTTGAGRPKPGS